LENEGVNNAVEELRGRFGEMIPRECLFDTLAMAPIPVCTLITDTGVSNEEVDTLMRDHCIPHIYSPGGEMGERVGRAITLYLAMKVLANKLSFS
jgi:hypothetical protein